MNKITLFFFIIISLTSISCGKPPILNKKKSIEQSNYQIIYNNHSTAEIYWNTNLKAYEYLSARIEYRVNNILTSIPENYEIYLWMPSMGHGGPEIVIKEISQGIYLLSEIFFIMEGDWQIIIKTPSSEMSFNYDL